jgi:hypothetical protein
MLTNLCRARLVWGGIMRRQRMEAPGGSRAGARPRQGPCPFQLSSAPAEVLCSSACSAQRTRMLMGKF